MRRDSLENLAPTFGAAEVALAFIFSSDDVMRDARFEPDAQRDSESDGSRGVMVTRLVPNFQ
jgi:hypothetical protein